MARRVQTRPRRVRCPLCGEVYTAETTDRHGRTWRRTFGFPELTHAACAARRDAARQAAFEGRAHGRDEQDTVDPCDL